MSLKTITTIKTANNLIESISKFLTIIFMSIIIYTSKTIFDKGIARGYLPKWSDLNFLILGTFLSYSNFKLGVWLTINFLDEHINEKCRKGENRGNKLSRFGNHLSGVIFYTLVSLFLYFYLKE